MTEYAKEVGNATNAYPICNKNALFAISYYKMQAYYVKLSSQNVLLYYKYLCQK